MDSPMHRTTICRHSKMHVPKIRSRSWSNRYRAKVVYNPATMEFMQGLRKFCDENDMLLLIDEVQTGWCRTGAVMSYMNYGIKQDIVALYYKAL